MTKDEIIKDIAKRRLGVTTLESRHRDSLDFHDLSVWFIKDALTEAFESGMEFQADIQEEESMAEFKRWKELNP